MPASTFFTLRASCRMLPALLAACLPGCFMNLGSGLAGSGSIRDGLGSSPVPANVVATPLPGASASSSPAVSPTGSPVASQSPGSGASAAPSPQAPALRTFRVRFENVSTVGTLVTSAGTRLAVPLSAGVYTVHGAGSTPFFAPGGSARGTGLEQLAESGDPNPLFDHVATLAGPGAGKSRGIIGSKARIDPGDVVEIRIQGGGLDRLSFAFGLAEANDWFLGPADPGGIPLIPYDGTLSGDISHELGIWNAGTETDQELGIGSDQMARQTSPQQGAPEATSSACLERGIVVPAGLVERPLATTGALWDLAVAGEGFFGVRLLDQAGTRAYTRRGAFGVDSESFVVAAGSLQLDPPILIPSGGTDYSIDAFGLISGKLPAATVPVNLGQISTFKFGNPLGVKTIGKDLYVPTWVSGEPYEGSPGSEVGHGMLRSGTIQEPCREPPLPSRILRVTVTTE